MFFRKFVTVTMQEPGQVFDIFVQNIDASVEIIDGQNIRVQLQKKFIEYLDNNGELGEGISSFVILKASSYQSTRCGFLRLKNRARNQKTVSLLDGMLFGKKNLRVSINSRPTETFRDDFHNNQVLFRSEQHAFQLAKLKFKQEQHEFQLEREKFKVEKEKFLKEKESVFLDSQKNKALRDEVEWFRKAFLKLTL